MNKEQQPPSQGKGSRNRSTPKYNYNYQFINWNPAKSGQIRPIELKAGTKFNNNKYELKYICPVDYWVDGNKLWYFKDLTKDHYDGNVKESQFYYKDNELWADVESSESEWP